MNNLCGNMQNKIWVLLFKKKSLNVGLALWYSVLCHCLYWHPMLVGFQFLATLLPIYFPVDASRKVIEGGPRPLSPTSTCKTHEALGCWLPPGSTLAVEAFSEI